MKIFSVNERVLVKRFVEAEGLDGNIYNVYICNGIIRGIYWNWQDKNEKGWITHHSEELPTKSIMKVFGVTRKEFLELVSERHLESQDELFGCYSDTVEDDIECNGKSQEIDLPF